MEQLTGMPNLNAKRQNDSAFRNLGIDKLMFKLALLIVGPMHLMCCK